MGSSNSSVRDTETHLPSKVPVRAPFFLLVDADGEILGRFNPYDLADGSAKRSATG